MPAVSLVFVVLALLLTVGGGLLLYTLVRSEHEGRTVTDRQTAERMARRDGGDDEVEGNHWD